LFLYRISLPICICVCLSLCHYIWRSSLWSCTMQLIIHKTTQQTRSTPLAIYIQPPTERFISMLHNAFHGLSVLHNMSAEPMKIFICKHILGVLSPCVNHWGSTSSSSIVSKNNIARQEKKKGNVMAWDLETSGRERLVWVESNVLLNLASQQGGHLWPLRSSSSNIVVVFFRSVMDSLTIMT
jgi:hypothetical protein